MRENPVSLPPPTTRIKQFENRIATEGPVSCRRAFSKVGGKGSLPFEDSGGRGGCGNGKTRSGLPGKETDEGGEGSSPNLEEKRSVL